MLEEVTSAGPTVPDGTRGTPKLQGTAVTAMASAATTVDLAERSSAALGNASATLPAPDSASTRAIEEMREVLRAADCLYDSKEIWARLGATNVPEIPESVIREAYEKGGRVILRCSSISEKTLALRTAGISVAFWRRARQSNYQERVSTPEWIVVPSHIDRSTRGSPKREVVTSEMPAPTPEDWFAAIAYARLDGGRQPKGCEGLFAFTNEDGAVVGSGVDGIGVVRGDDYDRGGVNVIGAARFGPPRN